MAIEINSDFRPLQVCVLGLGYIGLPTAALLASRGHRVTGVDINSRIVATINKGDIHIVEPDLDLLVKTAVQSGRLSAKETPVPADVFIICVPTPFFHDTYQPNLEYVKAASESIVSLVRPGNIVILESTSPPGTTVNVVGKAIEASGLRVGEDCFLAHCPERVLPGAILREAVENDRIIGGYTPECSRRTMEFYRTFVNGEILLTDATTAETVKLAENASRDSQIAFANELSLIAASLELDVWEVIRLANRHPRVNILQPGPGVGGHCIAVDPWFLAAAAPEHSSLLRAARERNNSMPLETARRIADAARRSGGRTAALLGMAYKSDIDDCRESPSLDVHRELKKIAPDLEVIACEPYVDKLEGVELAPFPECVKRADVLAVLVAHRDFRMFDWTSLPPDKTVLDFKGILRRQA